MTALFGKFWLLPILLKCFHGCSSHQNHDKEDIREQWPINPIHSRKTSSLTDEKIVSWYVTGDTPYSDKDEFCLKQQLRDVDLLSEGSPSFLIHVGDIKDGYIPCTENTYKNIADIFSNPNLNYDQRDIFFVPGDNEWNDCSKTEAPRLAIDPPAKNNAWDKWMNYFGPENSYGFGVMSSNVNVERQRGVYRKSARNRTFEIERTENFSFFLKDTLFVGVNMVGGFAGNHSNNIRLKQNFEWTKKNLLKYSRNMKGAVIFGHAQLTGQLRHIFFRNPLFKFIRKHFPTLPVIYIHGNTHRYKFSFPDSVNGNFVSLSVAAGGNAPPSNVALKRNKTNGKMYFEVENIPTRYSHGCPLLPKLLSVPDSSRIENRPFFVIKSKLSSNLQNWCVGLSSHNVTDGNLIRLRICNGSPHQEWRIDSLGYIHNRVNDGQCMIPVNGSEEPGTKLMLWSCSADTYTFSWALHSEGFIAFGKGLNTFLSVRNGNTYNGSQLQISRRKGDKRQQWDII